MLRAPIESFAQFLLGQFPSLEQAELDFAASFPHGLIYRPNRDYQLPGEPLLDDRYILLNFGVGSADMDRFLISMDEVHAVRATAIFQELATMPGAFYASLGEMQSEIQSWVNLGDEIEVGGAASITGSDKRNFDLSEQRAQAVTQWIVDELGGDTDKIYTRWVGERPWPQQFDNDASVLFVQRRVEIRRLMVEWDMDEFDRIIPELGNTPQDRRIEQLIRHLQADKDDVCVILPPLGSLRILWMRARFDPEQAWVHDITQWDSQGPASPTGMVTKLRWEIERTFHRGMQNSDMLRKIREVDDRLMYVRTWTLAEHLKAAKAASLMSDPSTIAPSIGLAQAPPLYLDNLEKHLHEWFTLKESQPNSIYHEMYKMPAP